MWTVPEVGVRATILVAMTSLVGAGNPSRVSAETWARSFAIEQSVRLQVNVDRAHVRLDTWARPRMDVRVVTTGWKFGPDGLRVRAWQDSQGVHAEVRIPSFGFDPAWIQRSIEVVIRLPSDADVEIETEDGDIWIPPMRGRFRIRTSDGYISAVQLVGDIEMRSWEGAIRARELDGTLVARTGTGDLDVDGRFDQLFLASDGGQLFARIRPGSRPNSAWTVESTDGRIWLELPANLDVRLDAESRSGRVQFVGGRGPDDEGARDRALPTFRIRTDAGDILIHRR